MLREGSKTKIFLFLAFGLLSVVFFTSVYRIITDLFSGIDAGNNAIKCNDAKYQVMNVDYTGNKLLFEIRNQGMNISKVTLSSDLGTNVSLEVSPPLSRGASKFFVIENITIRERFYYFIENCEKNIMSGEI